MFENLILGIPPQAGETSVLMHFNGANNGRVFIDECGNSAVLSGTRRIVTSSTRTKFGNTLASLNQAESGSNLTISGPNIFPEGDGDFTIEFFFYPQTSVVGTVFYILNAGKFNIILNQGTQQLAVRNVTTSLYTFTAVLPSVWCHYAIVRRNGFLKLFRDGVLVASNRAFNQNMHSQNIRLFDSAGGSDSPLVAYMDEFRVSKYAVYDANFEVPTAPFTLP